MISPPDGDARRDLGLGPERRCPNPGCDAVVVVLSPPTGHLKLCPTARTIRSDSANSALYLRHSGAAHMREVDCGVKHQTIVEAIEHARRNLGMTREMEHPKLGTKTSGPMANKDRIIGFTDPTGKKSWRVDFDPEKGCHINETDYADKNAFRKVCHRIPLHSDQWTMLWWKKFTSAGLESYKNKPVNLRDQGDEAEV